MCYFPRLIKNRKYVSNKKNGGNPPPVLDERVKWVPIGCGKCLECMKQKANGWKVRLLEDIKTHRNGVFVTLTFSNEAIWELRKRKEIKNLHGYELDNQLVTTAVKLFRERWRKRYGKSIRHWLVSELGHNGTENVHLHGILWTSESAETISNLWQYGFTWPGKNARKTNFVNGKTVSYITKYIHKIDKDHREYMPIVLTSAGIGSNYTESTGAQLNKYRGEETKDTYTTKSGHQLGLPTYWKNKIYSDQERESMWLKKLDEGYRYIAGVKVHESETKKIDKLIKAAREKNKRLGYGSDEKNWDRKEYETQRRNMLYDKRMEAVKKAWIE